MYIWEQLMIHALNTNMLSSVHTLVRPSRVREWKKKGKRDRQREKGSHENKEENLLPTFQYKHIETEVVLQLLFPL